MKTDDIKTILDKFYEGETTLAEEQQLLQYFESDHVAEELLDDKEMFLQLYSAAPIEVPRALESTLSNLIDSLAAQDTAPKQEQDTKPKVIALNRSKKQLWVWATAAAASIAIIVSTALLFDRQGMTQTDHVVAQQDETDPKDTFTNPDEAYREAEKALLLMSTNMNKGLNQLSKVSEPINKTNDIIEKSTSHLKNRES